jgi:alkanesulfonate monooxygenase SsuD/methylene tetrahydromethanopterin reductase-like flavin-dependent oxidoreductase (luciferase family)
VKFGLFYELQTPEPWEDGAEQRVIREALEQAELADRLGIEFLWEVEHHFLEEYSHSSAPEIFLAAVSQRTKNLRVAHGIVALPNAYNHPARVAERIATLDLVSEGRLEFGTGETSSDMELGGFMIPREQKRAMWEESIQAICRMFVEVPFAGHNGEYLNMPPRNVVPKPAQKPHPPLWVACSRRDTILLAAQKGIGALTFAFVSPEEASQWVNDYYKVLYKECEPIGFAVNPNIATVAGFMCDKDGDRARKKGMDGALFFAYSLAHYYYLSHHQHLPGQTNVYKLFEQEKHLMGMDPEAVRKAGFSDGSNVVDPGGLACLTAAIGSPHELRLKLRDYEDAGVDQIILIAQAGKNRHEDICESIELFAKEVLPEFKERDERRQREKAARLEPIMERLTPKLEAKLAEARERAANVTETVVAAGAI